jgi:hydrogenase nickel incorporation protein HypB
MIQDSLANRNLGELDFLFIENVGNLVCPTTYDLGEDLRAVLFSVTEGEDKPLKYPPIFNTEDLAIITKMDFAPAAEFDLTRACRSVESVHRGMDILQVSAKTGVGLPELLTMLESRRRQTIGTAAAL